MAVVCTPAAAEDCPVGERAPQPGRLAAQLLGVSGEQVPVLSRGFAPGGAYLPLQAPP